MCALKLTDAEYADAKRRYDEWTRARCAVAGKFFRMDAARACARAGFTYLGPAVLSRIENDMITAGELVRLPHNAGFTRRGVVQPAVTLATLLVLAEQCVDETRVLSAGRRAKGVALEALTTAQYKAARVAAGVMAWGVAHDAWVAGGRREAEPPIEVRWDRMGGADRPHFEAVGPQHLGVVAGAGQDGSDAWAAVLAMPRWSDARACLKEGRAPGDPGWDRRANADARAKHCGGIKLLLDLARAKGALADGVEPVIACHAAELQPLYDDFRAILEPRVGTSYAQKRKLWAGLRILLTEATRRRWLSRDAIDWTALGAGIERAHAEGVIGFEVHNKARWTYNHLRDAGCIDAPRWKTQSDVRTSLVANDALRDAAMSGDFSGWVASALPDVVYRDGLRRPDGRVFVQALAEGLERWRRWATLDDGLLEDAGLPARDWVDPTPEQARAAARQAKRGTFPFKLTLQVVESRLSNFAQLAGWAAATRGVDWTREGLDTLTDPALLEAWRQHRIADDPEFRAMTAEERSKHQPSDSLVSATAFALGTLAAPFLEAYHARIGDQAAAVRARAHGERLKLLGVRYMPHRDERKSAQAVAKVWERGGTTGWEKLCRLRDLLIREVELEGARCVRTYAVAVEGTRVEQRLAAGAQLSCDDQAERIRADREARRAYEAEQETRAESERTAFAPTWVPSLTWAIAVRDALLITLLVRIPLRRGNVSNLRTAWWKDSGRGGVQLEFPGYAMKGRRPFEPSYLLDEEVDDAEVAAAARLDLVALYRMEDGGARAELLRRADGTPTTSDYLFVPAVRKGGVEGQAWDPDAVSATYTALVDEYAEAIGLDPAELEACTHGSRSIHSERHHYATHFANSGERGLLFASKMLDHASPRITSDRYVGISVRRMTARGLGASTLADVQRAMRGRSNDVRPLLPEGAPHAVAPDPAPSMADALGTELAKLQALLEKGWITPQDHELLVGATVRRLAA